MSTRRSEAPPKRLWEMELADVEHVRRSAASLHFLALRWQDALFLDSEPPHGPGGAFPVDSSTTGGGGGGGLCGLSPFMSASVECRGGADAAELESLVAMARQRAPPRLRHIGYGVLVVPPIVETE